MAEPFATVGDLRKHWSALPEEQEDDAEQKLLEASVILRGLYPDIDRRVVEGTLDADVPRLVVNRMVKRAMSTPSAEEMAGVAQATGQTGPFTTTFQFANPDGNMYVSREDRKLLGSTRNTKQAFTIMPGGGDVRRFS